MSDLGGDAACWAHLHDVDRDDIRCTADIERLVRDFYRAAAMDDLLGPIFEQAHVDWPQHIATLTEFWADQLFAEPGYEGNPLIAHRPVHARTPFLPAHYERWLALFTETVDERFAGPVTEQAKHKAQKMARALRRLLEGRSDPGAAPTDVALRPAPR